jgi:hypothetical protein
MTMKNPEQTLVKGLGKEQVLKLAQAASNDKSFCRELVKYIEVDESTRAAKAAWVLSHVASSHPDVLKQHVQSMLSVLSKAKTGGIQRELLKSLYHLKLSDTDFSKLIDLSFRYLADRNTDVGVKYYSTYILSDALKKYPDLSNEVKCALEETSTWHNEVWQRHVAKWLSKM